MISQQGSSAGTREFKTEKRLDVGQLVQIGTGLLTFISVAVLIISLLATHKI